jgi:outer membrane protein assembly factor BamB
MKVLALALALQAWPFGGGAGESAAPEKLWSVAWRRQVVPPQLLEWRPQELGGPAIDPLSGNVVLGTRDGWLHAYDRAGRRLWEVEAGGAFGAAPLVEGDSVFAGSSGGTLYALDRTSGAVRWTYEAHEDLGTTPAAGGGVVLVMTLQDTLLAVDRRTGAWKWHHRRETREGFTIRGAAGALVAGDLAIGAYSDGTVVALDLATGAVRWERKIAPAGDFVDVDGLRVQGGRLFAAAYSGAVYALDVRTGAQKWQLKTPGPGRLAVARDLLVVVTATQVLGVSSAGGRTTWAVPLDGAAVADPVFAGRLVAVGNSDPGTGVSAAPAALGRRVYLLSNGGALLALDLV